MNAKKIPGLQRALMLKRYMDRSLSNDTRDALTKHIVNCAPKADHATREAEAARINAIIDSSKTEAEIMEKLSKL